MATDILLYVERLSDGRWECLRPPPRDLVRYPRGDINWRAPDVRTWGPYGCMTEWVCYGAAGGCVDGNCVACVVTERGTKPHWTWYDNRNYGLFAILAGVRQNPNAPLDSIDRTRGLPADCTTPPRERFAEDGGDWSWLTLDEILTYDWDQMSPAEPSHPDGIVYRELAIDFLEFIDELVMPLLGTPYTDVLAVRNDALESGHAAQSELETEALRIAASIRFVIGFY